MARQLIYSNSQSGLDQLYVLIKANPSACNEIIILSDLTTQHNNLKIVPLKHLDHHFYDQSKDLEILVYTPISDFSSAIRDIRRLEILGFKTRLLPAMINWNSAIVKNQKTIPFSSKDIIKYPEFEVLSNFNFRGKSVLISGAAGSLGTHLSKTLHSQGCSKLILIDHSEHLTSKLNQELNLEKPTNHSTISIIVDVRDEIRLGQIFEDHKPDIVFHLAAYKHVELMETDPYSAFKVNVIGSRNIFEVALNCNTTQFNFISTDKAVEPKCIMGFTKKIAENLILNYTQNSMKVNILRFGNILGSSGSVIEKFNSKLKHNQPLSITEANIYRYFNLIEDVVNFILISPFMAEHRETMVFYSGSDSSILSLAKAFLKLNGIQNNLNDYIEILDGNSFEKQKEKLFSNDEKVLNTNHPHIKKISAKHNERLSKQGAISNINHQLNQNRHLTLEDFKVLVSTHNLQLH